MNADRILFLDLGEPGSLSSDASPLDQWQDHGLGLLRTILHRESIPTRVASIRAHRSWSSVARDFRSVGLLVMNVRSYTFPHARQAARLFKQVNPAGRVLTGGIHAAVAPDEMLAVAEFDRICTGPGERLIVDLVRDPDAFPRIFPGRGAASMAEWPAIDRTLWPAPHGFRLWRRRPWPLEPSCGWGPGPVATILTSRSCPWHCVFCNESAYVSPMGRRPVQMVVDELNALDERHGPLGSVVIHDSLFFQSPSWLREWLDAYPRLARRPWPYWAAARTDLVCRWPDLFEALLRETNWSTISLGLESGSDRVLRTLNKECSAAENAFAIDLVNRVGDEMEAAGRPAPRIWANIMLGIPGETREDAFMTLGMVRRIKRCLLSPSHYAPYPGTALGAQLAAEGKSLMTRENYHRYPRDSKLLGIDYDFYRDLLAGRYEAEVAARPWPDGLGASDSMAGPPARRGTTRFYLFETSAGRRKIAWGLSPEDALDVLALRLSPEEMRNICRDRYETVRQADIPSRVAELG